MKFDLTQVIGIVVASNIPTAVVTFLLNRKKVNRESDAIIFEQWQKLEARVSLKNEILEERLTKLEEKITNQNKNILKLETKITNQNKLITKLNSYIDRLNDYFNDLNNLIIKESPHINIPDKPKIDFVREIDPETK
jgi:Uncharacterized protein conserved in bacteria